MHKLIGRFLLAAAAMVTLYFISSMTDTDTETKVVLLIIWLLPTIYSFFKFNVLEFELLTYLMVLLFFIVVSVLIVFTSGTIPIILLIALSIGLLRRAWRITLANAFLKALSDEAVAKSRLVDNPPKEYSNSLERYLDMPDDNAENK